MGNKRLNDDELLAVLSKLNAKQRIFAEEYCKDFNAARAFRAAGYSASNAGSEAAAASRLLKTPNIDIYVSHIKAKATDEAVVVVRDILLELKKIGFSNLQDYLDTGNRVKDISAIDRELASAVAGLTINETVRTDGDGATIVNSRINIKLADKLAALEKLGRYLGMWGDRLADAELKDAVWIVQRPTR